MSLGPRCGDSRERRADVRAVAELNAIDYVEVSVDDQTRIHVHFVHPVPPADPGDPSDADDAWGLSADPGRVTISGGRRVVGIEVESVRREPDGHLVVRVSEPGDFSRYLLEIRAPELDPRLRTVEVSFKAGCPVDVDCGDDPICPPEPLEEPDLDYMAKDYASFRRLMLDLLPRLNPEWTERNPADLGMTLLELLAYTGDRISYHQDAVAAEAYLETARQRTSVRRHARLVDYRMHEGRNAWAPVHLRVSAAATLPPGTPFVTRITTPLAGETTVPGPRIDAAALTVRALEEDPALAGAVAFESTHAVALAPQNNEIRIHAWGDEECCLPPGTREAWLFHVPRGGGDAVRPSLSAGDLVLLEETSGPVTGLPADADREHRHLVRLVEEPEETVDPVYAAGLPGGELRLRSPGDDPLPLLRVRWRAEDALPFPLCLSTRLRDGTALTDVSVARGNVVLVDHGLTHEEPLERAGSRGRPVLSRGPLTFQCQPGSVRYDPGTGRLETERRDLLCEPGEASPAVAVFADLPTGEELWTAVPDLLDSPPFAQHFVAEVDDRGRAHLRFGDGSYGRRLDAAAGLRAVYRVGNGRAGNAGAETVAHVALPGPAGWLEAVRNPLPARHGADPESMDRVRRIAPQAFRATQLRAVTEADWARAAETLPSVAGAVASFRWTGSWHTAFVGIDPADPADLVLRPAGGVELAGGLRREVADVLGRYRLAGYDFEIRPPRFVPLEIRIEVCAHPDHYRADVKSAVRSALGDERLPDGGRGFFHPDHFGFGDPLHLSRLYAAVERVPGVDSARVTTFRRWGRPSAGELVSGVLSVGPWEIVQLENDPDFLENGVLEVSVRGGKG